MVVVALYVPDLGMQVVIAYVFVTYACVHVNVCCVCP